MTVDAKTYTIYAGIMDEDGVLSEDVFFPVTEEELNNYDHMVQLLQYHELDIQVINMAMDFPAFAERLRGRAQEAQDHD